MDHAIIGGTRLRDWLGGAMSDPGMVYRQDRHRRSRDRPWPAWIRSLHRWLAERRVPRRLGRAGHPGDRHVARLGGDALQPAAHRRIPAEVEAWPRPPRACTRRARCRRSSTAHRRTRRASPGAAPSRRAPRRPARACRAARARRGDRRAGAAPCSAASRRTARGCTARRTSTAAPARGRARPSGRKRVPSARYQRMASDSGRQPCRRRAPASGCGRSD